MRFTADQAFEVRGTDDAIILDALIAARILKNHAATLEEYLAEVGKRPEDNHDTPVLLDAGDVLAWLGY